MDRARSAQDVIADERWPARTRFDDVAEGHRVLEERDAFGKVVLRL